MFGVASKPFAQDFANPLPRHSRARGNPGDSENGKPGFRLARPRESGDHASLAGMTVGEIATLTFLLLLVLSAPAFLHAQALPAAEKQKIETLIKYVGDLNDAKFVRNGSTYEPSTAVRFLRGKWNANKTEVNSARDFIDKVASMSGTSGKPYLIRFNDGREIYSREFLLTALKKIET
jgi:uncharacterized protein DUF5329